MDAPAAPKAPRLDLRKRLILVVLLVGLVPLLIAAGVAHHLAQGSLQAAAVEKLEAVRDARAQQIEDTYRTIRAQVLDLATSRTVTAGLAELGPALRRLPQELGWTDGSSAPEEAREAVRAFYEQTFAARYRASAGQGVDTTPLVPTAPWAVAAQQTWLASNPHPPGERMRLDVPPGDETTYGRSHAVHHPILRGFLERFGYYDLFLVDREGVVVYTVAKEIDFATDLQSGPYRNTLLAQVAQRALDATDSEAAFLTDYARYLPSCEDPAAFIATPVFSEGKPLGALVLQMPIGRLNAVMTSAAGLGDTGETFLVGPDRKMRSDSRLHQTSTLLVQEVDTVAARAALEGRTGNGIIQDHRGLEVVSAWMPLDLLGLGYGLIAEVETQEAFAPARHLFRWLLGLTAVLVLLSLGVSLWVASSLARPVGAVTDRLEDLAKQLLSASQEQQAGATEQSAAVEETRQTFQGLLEASTDMNRIGTEVLGHAEIGQRSAQTIGASIESLSTRTRNISEVLDLVKDIANKSEILALNAALEGTKAGEAGRGFSLVAQQMQRLAEQVMGSVKTIENLTSEIGHASRGAVLAAEEAEKVARLTTESARAIAGAVGQQVASAEQVSVAMDEISQVASSNVPAARQVVDSANELLRVAELLRATVGVRG